MAGRSGSVIWGIYLYARANPRTLSVSGRGNRMSNTTARRALSFLIVGAMVLAGLFVLVTAAPVASARAIESPATPTAGVTGSPRLAESPSTAALPAVSRPFRTHRLDDGHDSHLRDQGFRQTAVRLGHRDANGARDGGLYESRIDFGTRVGDQVPRTAPVTGQWSGADGLVDRPLP